MNSNTSKPWYKTPLVWMLIFIPMSAVIAGIITVIIAFRTDDGLVKDDYYSYGKQINRVLERDKAAELLGLTANLKFDFDSNTVTTNIIGSSDFIPPGLITAELLHATRAGNDRTLTLQRTAEDNYFSIVPELAQGHWLVQLSADNWRISGDLYIPGSAEISITSR